MFCSICKRYGKPPAVARGAWVSCPVNNWVKATELLSKRDKSEWHLEASVLAESAKKTGDVVERMLVATKIDRKRNPALMKKLIWTLYFLVKHHIPHTCTTTFEHLITLQIGNGSKQLEEHRRTCLSNASICLRLPLLSFCTV